MAVMHLPIKFSADIFILFGVINIFPKFKMVAAAILDFQVMWIWPFSHADGVVFVFCIRFGSNICYSHWDRRTYPSDLHFDVVTRINFLSRLLVTWSSPHGCGASSHTIWCRYLRPIRSYWRFPKLKVAAAAIVNLLGAAMEPPTTAHSAYPCKNFVMIG